MIKLWNVDLDSIYEEQYVLSRKVNISISESNEMADFERQIFVNLYFKEKQEEQRHLERSKNR
jgi:hypothetical protein